MFLSKVKHHIFVIYVKSVKVKASYHVFISTQNVKVNATIGNNYEGDNNCSATVY